MSAKRVSWRTSRCKYTEWVHWILPRDLRTAEWTQSPRNTVGSFHTTFLFLRLWDYRQLVQDRECGFFRIHLYFIYDWFWKILGIVYIVWVLSANKGLGTFTIRVCAIIYTGYLTLLYAKNGIKQSMVWLRIQYVNRIDKFEFPCWNEGNHPNNLK